MVVHDNNTITVYPAVNCCLSGIFGVKSVYLLTGHTLPLKVIGFGTPLAIGEPKVKLSSPTSPVRYLPRGQLLGFPSFDVDDPRRQKMN